MHCTAPILELPRLLEFIPGLTHVPHSCHRGESTNACCRCPNRSVQSSQAKSWRIRVRSRVRASHCVFEHVALFSSSYARTHISKLLNRAVKHTHTWFASRRSVTHSLQTAQAATSCHNLPQVAMCETNLSCIVVGRSKSRCKIKIKAAHAHGCARHDVTGHDMASSPAEPIDSVALFEVDVDFDAYFDFDVDAQDSCLF